MWEEEGARSFGHMYTHTFTWKIGTHFRRNISTLNIVTDTRIRIICVIAYVVGKCTKLYMMVGHKYFCTHMNVHTHMHTAMAVTT